MEAKLKGLGDNAARLEPTKSTNERQNTEINKGTTSLDYDKTDISIQLLNTDVYNLQI